MRISLIVPLDDPACSCCCSHALVGRNEYRGTGGCGGAGSMSGKGVIERLGAPGKGGLRGHAVIVWGKDVTGGWARLTRSSPDELDSLSDSGIWRSLDGAGIDCVNFNSFAGNQVSSNFTSWEITKCW